MWRSLSTLGLAVLLPVSRSLGPLQHPLLRISQNGIAASDGSYSQGLKPQGMGGPTSHVRDLLLRASELVKQIPE